MAIRQQITDKVEGRLHQVHVGVGEAIQRLIDVEFKYRLTHGDLPEILLQERVLLVEALNQFELELGFDCNEDGVPDNIAVFEASASKSCCRILPFDTSRRTPLADLKPKAPPPKKRWGLFRRKEKSPREDDK